jgi:integrase/recombinase XerC
MNEQLTNYIHFLSHQKRASRHTVQAYETDLQGFFSHVGVSKLEEVEREDIRSYVVYRMNERVSPRTISRELSSIRSFIKYGMKRKWIDQDPALGVKSPKLGKQVPRFVSKRDMMALLDSLDFRTEDVMEYQSGLIVAVLYATGIRRAELMGIRIEDIDFAEKRIRVTGKRSKERVIPLTNELSHLIKEFIIKRKAYEVDHPYLFFTVNRKPLYPKMVYNLVHKALSGMNVRQKSPHVLRHSIATHLLGSGAPINSIKDLLGHSNLAATQLYTHSDIEELKSMHELSHPRS